MENCIFCKIIAGEIPSQKLYEDDEIIIIKDVAPQAKIHLLCIPKEHFTFLSEMDEKRAECFKRTILKINKLQNELGLKDGYRLMINQGEQAGQTVPHLHIHLLGGEKLD